MPLATLRVHNKQRPYRLDTRTLTRMAKEVADSLFDSLDYEITVRLVGPRAMARINMDYLQHSGPTDVITFNLSDPDFGDLLFGDIVVCPSVAQSQGDELQIPWHEETLRYVVHGLLHLKGYDDHTPTQRTQMKRQEEHWMQTLKTRWDLASWQHAILPSATNAASSR